MSTTNPWLDAELDHLWILAESELRRLQALALRAPPTAPALAEIEAALAARRAARHDRTAQPFAAAELADAHAQVHARLAPLRPAILARFDARLGLTAPEVDALVAIAAPSIDPALADLFAILRGPGARRGVDVALLAQLLGTARRVDTLALLDEHRPPIALRLIQVAPAHDTFSSAAYRAIQPTLDLLWVLTTAGDDASPSLHGAATILRRPATWQGMLVEPEVAAWAGDLAHRFASATTALPWLVLYGATGAGKREIAARLAAFGRRPLLCVRPPIAVAKPSPNTPPPLSLVEVVRRAVRDAAWTSSVLYLGPLAEDDLHEQPEVIALLEACRVPVVLGFAARRPPRLKTHRPLAEHALPVPQLPGRLALWKQATAGVALAADADLARIAHNYKLTPGDILEAGREIAVLAGDAPATRALLRAVLERRLRNELGGIATRVVANTTWDDVILPHESRERLRELIARKQHEDRVYREWDLDRHIGYGKGVIALLSGPPGTGKTLLAGLVANELGYELYQIDLSQIFSRYLGETEKALERVFDQAETAHAVLLFDEADALFAKRTQVDDSNDRYANAAVNFLLQRLERYTGVAVLTTNKDTSLDEALRRRLSLHLQIEEPEPLERLALWQKFLPRGVPGSATVDVARLAAELELTGGYIKNVAVRATFLAAAENTPLSTSSVRRAAHLELEDLGRVVTWPEDLETTHRSLAALAPAGFDYVDG